MSKNLLRLWYNYTLAPVPLSRMCVCTWSSTSSVVWRIDAPTNQPAENEKWTKFSGLRINDALRRFAQRLGAGSRNLAYRTVSRWMAMTDEPVCAQVNRQEQNRYWMVSISLRWKTISIRSDTLDGSTWSKATCRATGTVWPMMNGDWKRSWTVLMQKRYYMPIKWRMISLFDACVWFTWRVHFDNETERRNAGDLHTRSCGHMIWCEWLLWFVWWWDVEVYRLDQQSKWYVNAWLAVMRSVSVLIGDSNEMKRIMIAIDTSSLTFCDDENDDPLLLIYCIFPVVLGTQPHEWVPNSTGSTAE